MSPAPPGPTACPTPSSSADSDLCCSKPSAAAATATAAAAAASRKPPPSSSPRPPPHHHQPEAPALFPLLLRHRPRQHLLPLGGAGGAGGAAHRGGQGRGGGGPGAGEGLLGTAVCMRTWMRTGGGAPSIPFHLDWRWFGVVWCVCVCVCHFWFALGGFKLQARGFWARRCGLCVVVLVWCGLCVCGRGCVCVSYWGSGLVCVRAFAFCSGWL